MTTEPHGTPDPAVTARSAVAAGSPDPAAAASIEAPQPTIAPFILIAGLSLAAAGLAFATPLFLATGGVIFLVGLAGWIGQLLPGRGHAHLEASAPLPSPVPVAHEAVRHLLGLPGFRVQLPMKIHPISAGVWGGAVGGALMPIPALAYGLLSEHHSIWYPVNLLAGMVLPVNTSLNLADFHWSLFIVAVVIHVSMCLAIGLMLGVMLPTLPPVPQSIAWGGLLTPLLWTAVSYIVMRFVNPLLEQHVEWPWFIVSQFVFGVGAATVIANTRHLNRVFSGLLAGAVGGMLMAIPALLWSLSTGRGVWYPVNLLAGMAVPDMAVSEAQLQQFHAEWFIAALLMHIAFATAFGLTYAFTLPKARPIPAPFVWGALLLPLLWSGASYGLMGVVNPALQGGVDWPWFILSQFVFGIAAATVVTRTEMIDVPPAGPGREPPSPAVSGPTEVRP